MNLSKHLIEPEILLIFSLRDHRGYITLLELLNKEIADLTEKVLSKPIVDDNDLKRDLRFKMGEISGLKRMLTLMNEIEELIQ